MTLYLLELLNDPMSHRGALRKSDPFLCPDDGARKAKSNGASSKRREPQ
jgi:hypothetical protein